MAVAKTPALPLYGKDAYDDESFSRLSFAAQGFYWFLAWWQWSEGSIPADLELVLDKVPRKKIAEARRVWVEVLPFFPSLPDGERRANGTVEHHRSKVCGDRERRQKGAAITNAKRWGESRSDSLSESLSDTVSDSPRAANASAIGSLSQLTRNGVGVQGEGIAVAPDFAVVSRVYDKLRQSALKEIPPEQVAVGLVTDFGEELILETLIDCENEYRGMPWRYFEKILIDRNNNPEKRPGRRRARKAADGNGHKLPSLAIGAHPPTAVTTDDVGEVQTAIRYGWSRTDIAIEDAEAWLTYLRVELDGDLSKAQTLAEFTRHRIESAEAHT